MTQWHRRDGLWVAVLGLILVAGTGRTAPFAPDKLPESVSKTFHAAFPNGVIQKLDAEEENGVMVFDFEFLAGDREKEADITGDGTMIESTLVITPKDIPALAMKTIRATAKGAKLGRCEWIETRYDLKEGKVVPMDKPMIKYAAEMSKAGKKAEVIVTAGGAMVEAPEWMPDTTAKAPAQTPGKTGK
jgi:hypothetical protein